MKTEMKLPRAQVSRQTTDKFLLPAKGADGEANIDEQHLELVAAVEAHLLAAVNDHVGEVVLALQPLNNAVEAVVQHAAGHVRAQEKILDLADLLVEAGIGALTGQTLPALDGRRHRIEDRLGPLHVGNVERV